MKTLLRGALRFVGSVVAVGGLAAVSTVAAWWLVGADTSVPAEIADYAVQPPRIAPGAETAAGIAALVLLGGVLALTGWATVARRGSRRWWFVVPAVILAGSIAGFSFRVMTAPVIGANIGAGLALIFFLPIAAALLVWALVWSLVLLRRPADPTTAQTPGGPAAQTPGVTTTQTPGGPTMQTPGVTTTQTPGGPTARTPGVTTTQTPGGQAGQERTLGRPITQSPAIRAAYPSLSIENGYSLRSAKRLIAL